MQLRGRSRRIEYGILVSLALLAGGCGSGTKSGPPMGDVRGTITYQQQPVAGANVTFVPTTRETPAAAAVTGSDGSYKLSISGQQQGAVTGNYQVMITLNAPYDGPLPKDMSAEAAKEIYVGKSLIPEKYRSPATSQLTAEVKPGSNTLDFVLQD